MAGKSNWRAAAVEEEVRQRRLLATAPRVVQELYWRRYNLLRGRRRMPAALGELAARAWPESGPPNAAVELAVVEAAWHRVLPAEFSDAARVEGFRRGRLRVAAMSAAARFVLERQLGSTLLVALNAALGNGLRGRQVVGIDFRLEPEQRSKAPRRPRMNAVKRDGNTAAQRKPTTLRRDRDIDA